MPPDRLTALLDFVQRAEALKDTLRSGHTAGGRRESTAEHSWRLCLMVLTFRKELHGIDLLRLLELCILHDLAEAVHGDVPATEQREGDDRAERERRALEQLTDGLPADVADRIRAAAAEYEAAATPEAIMAKGFDKIETMLQHLAGANPLDFDYAFNVTYGRAATDRHPLLRAIRAPVEAETARRASLSRS
ncbi:HD domain-containing protein [Roseobacter sp. HKCCA0434]|uniref:HD domain-containing protein n=1 Tax=Roseobacter sp. HKCCA0434 TaxID=3079297 RepID=UPI002905D95A|nr:HD domain-containing protein [Roseobacter sp. HKCCA0434]